MQEQPINFLYVAQAHVIQPVFLHLYIVWPHVLAVQGILYFGKATLLVSSELSQAWYLSFLDYCQTDSGTLAMKHKSFLLTFAEMLTVFIYCYLSELFLTFKLTCGS